MNIHSGNTIYLSSGKTIQVRLFISPKQSWQSVDYIRKHSHMTQKELVLNTTNVVSNQFWLLINDLWRFGLATSESCSGGKLNHLMAEPFGKSWWCFQLLSVISRSFCQRKARKNRVHLYALSLSSNGLRCLYTTWHFKPCTHIFQTRSNRL